jgi:hypothetical protein
MAVKALISWYFQEYNTYNTSRILSLLHARVLQATELKFQAYKSPEQPDIGIHILLIAYRSKDLLWCQTLSEPNLEQNLPICVWLTSSCVHYLHDTWG